MAYKEILHRKIIEHFGRDPLVVQKYTMAYGTELKEYDIPFVRCEDYSNILAKIVYIDRAAIDEFDTWVFNYMGVGIRFPTGL